MKNVICIDFDGVICNSMRECLITGYNAWLKYNGQDAYYSSEEGIPEDLTQYFYDWRGYVRTGGQYYVIFHSFLNSRLKSEEEFESASREYQKEIKDYHKLFFEARDKIRDSDIDYWVGLHDPYNGVSAGFEELTKKADVYVVTGKDGRSVKAFLEFFGINFPEEKIYDKDAANDKLAAIEVIAAKIQRPLEDIVFLDDNIHHLRPPKESGCTVFMAGWGYHCQEHLDLARENDIEILQLNNWKDRILKELNVGALQ